MDDTDVGGDTANDRPYGPMTAVKINASTGRPLQPAPENAVEVSKVSFATRRVQILSHI